MVAMKLDGNLNLRTSPLASDGLAILGRPASLIGYLCGSLSAAGKLTHESMHTHDPQGEMYCIHSVSWSLTSHQSFRAALLVVCMCMHAYASPSWCCCAFLLTAGQAMRISQCSETRSIHLTEALRGLYVLHDGK